MTYWSLASRLPVNSATCFAKSIFVRGEKKLLAGDGFECYGCAEKTCCVQILVNHSCGLGLLEKYGVTSTRRKMLRGLAG